MYITDRSCIEPFRLSFLLRPEFLNLCTIDILDQIIFWGVERGWSVLCRMFAASLASTHYMPGAPPPNLCQDNQKYGRQKHQNPFPVENHWLRLKHAGMYYVSQSSLLDLVLEWFGFKIGFSLNLSNGIYIRQFIITIFHFVVERDKTIKANYS